MAQITIRNLEPRVVERLKKRAAANGRSLEGEIRLLLAWIARGEIRAAEESPAYRSLERVARPLPDAQTLGPPKIVRFPRVLPIKLEGRPVSARLIEDRR